MEEAGGWRSRGPQSYKCKEVNSADNPGLREREGRQPGWDPGDKRAETRLSRAQTPDQGNGDDKRVSSC